MKHVSPYVVLSCSQQRNGGFMVVYREGKTRRICYSGERLPEGANFIIRDGEAVRLASGDPE